MMVTMTMQTSKMTTPTLMDNGRGGGDAAEDGGEGGGDD